MGNFIQQDKVPECIVVNFFYDTNFHNQDNDSSTLKKIFIKINQK
jgi:hypothetical protein